MDTNPQKQKEQTDKFLLNLEIILIIIAIAVLLAFVLISAYIEMALWLRIALVAFGATICAVVFLFSLKIEQIAGFYECKHCHHKYIPTFKQIFLSAHMGRTRHLKCPHCGKKSWSKKVVSKE